MLIRKKSQLLVQSIVFGPSLMFTSINRTVFDIPLTWDRTRFEASRSKCRQARRLIDMSVNGKFKKQRQIEISFYFVF